MAISDFKLKLYNDLKDELNEHTVAIGFDRHYFLVDIATNAKELRDLLKRKHLYGVLCDNTIIGNVAYLIDSEQVVVDMELVKESATGYAVSQLLLACKREPANIEKEVTFNNRLTSALHDFFRGYKDLDAHIEMDSVNVYGDEGDLPDYKTLQVIRGNINLYITGQQMSFLTAEGLIKIHNDQIDIEVEDLEDLISRVFGINRESLIEVLLGD